jgi:hypothetical protein
MTFNKKIILLFTTIVLMYLLVDNLSLHERSYKDLYNKIPHESSVAKSCSLIIQNTQIIASDCIKVSSSEWHIKPCGSSHWCSVNILGNGIKLSNKKFCKDESSVFFSKILLNKYYYKRSSSNKVEACLKK